MSQAAALVIFVISTEAAAPVNVALERSAREVLGVSASVEVQTVSRLPSDEDAVRSAPGAQGVVELTWGDDGRVAVLHCYLARERRWVDRTITFDQDDAVAERGRLLGFAVASMLLEGPPDARAEAAGDAPVAIVPLRVDQAERDPGLSPPQRPARYALELAGAAAVAVGGDGDGLGLTAGWRPRLGSSFWLRFGLSGRLGEVEAAQATTRQLGGSVGIVWDLRAANAPGRLGLAFRADAIGGWLQVSHLSEDDPAPDRQSRWQFAGDLLAEGSLGLADSTSLFMGLGAEATVGTTALYTHGEQVAQIPVLRLVGELGARTRF